MAAEEQLRIEVPDLGKGMNITRDPEQLPSGGWSKLVNFYPYAGGVMRRPGAERITDTAVSGPLRGLFAWRKRVVSRPLPIISADQMPANEPVPTPPDDYITPVVIGGRTAFALIPPGSTSIVGLDGATGGPEWPVSDFAWGFAPYGPGLYATRPDGGTLRRISVTENGSGGSVRLAGHLAPSGAPTIVELAGGDIEQGTYYVVYQDVGDGWETNPSPVTTITTSGANKTLALVGDNPVRYSDTKKRRWYRSLPNVDGEYYLVGSADVEGGVANRFLDSVAVLGLGAPVSFANCIPPDGLRACAVHNERMWATNGQHAFFSELFLPESWGLATPETQESEGNALPLNPDAGGDCRAVLAGEDRVFFGKSNEVLYVTGDDISTFRVWTLDDEHGVASQHAMAWAGGRLLWYDGSNILRSSGGPGEIVGGEDIRAFLDRVLPDRKQYAVAGVYEPLSMFLLSVTIDTVVSSTPTTNNLVLALNYETGAWCALRYPLAGTVGGSDLHAPSSLHTGVDRYGNAALYATFYDGYPVRLMVGRKDWNNPIPALAQTKAYTGKRGRKLASRIIHLRYQLGTTTSIVGLASTPMDIRVGGILNTGQELMRTRTVDLSPEGTTSGIFDEQVWHAFALSTTGYPTNGLVVVFDYEGERELTIQEMIIDAVQLERTAQVR